MPTTTAKAPAANPRYETLRNAQIRSDKVNASRRAVMAGKGILLPDDSEPPFDPNPDVVPEDHVRVRCLRRGHDKISMGLSLPLHSDRFPKFQQGDVFVIQRDLAVMYETDDNFGWVEAVE